MFSYCPVTFTQRATEISSILLVAGPLSSQAFWCLQNWVATLADHRDSRCHFKGQPCHRSPCLLTAPYDYRKNTFLFILFFSCWTVNCKIVFNKSFRFCWAHWQQRNIFKLNSISSSTSLEIGLIKVISEQCPSSSVSKRPAGTVFTVFIESLSQRQITVKWTVCQKHFEWIALSFFSNPSATCTIFHRAARRVQKCWVMSQCDRE